MFLSNLPLISKIFQNTSGHSNYYSQTMIGRVTEQVNLLVKHQFAIVSWNKHPRKNLD